MGTTRRIKGTFEENLWILVKENAHLGRFRNLLGLRTNPICSAEIRWRKIPI